MLASFVASLERQSSCDSSCELFHTMRFALFAGAAAWFVAWQPRVSVPCCFMLLGRSNFEDLVLGSNETIRGLELGNAER